MAVWDSAGLAEIITENSIQALRLTAAEDSLAPRKIGLSDV